MEICRGDIIVVDLGQNTDSSIQCGIRPVLVVSNDKANTYSPILTIVPLTSKIFKKRYMPTHVFIRWEDTRRKHREALALAEQVTCIDRKDVLGRLGNIEQSLLDKVLIAVEVQIGLQAK